MVVIGQGRDTARSVRAFPRSGQQTTYTAPLTSHAGRQGGDEWRHWEFDYVPQNGLSLEEEASLNVLELSVSRWYVACTASSRGIESRRAIVGGVAPSTWAVA